MNIQTTYYKCYCTSIEMMRDRKFTVDKKDELTIDEFLAKFKNDELYYYATKSYEDKDDEINVIYFSKQNDSNLKKSDFVTITNKFKDEKTKELLVNKIIVVVNYKQNNTTSKLISQQFNFIELFQAYQLVINITKHNLVPKHELVEGDELTKLLKIYNPNEFPIILSNDPIVKYFNFRPKDIIKVTRTDVPNGIEIIYRLVR
jgi:DNA-directed RNA polymerase I, II, and III subunit RPABC1